MVKKTGEASWLIAQPNSWLTGLVYERKLDSASLQICSYMGYLEIILFSERKWRHVVHHIYPFYVNGSNSILVFCISHSHVHILFCFCSLQPWLSWTVTKSGSHPEEDMLRGTLFRYSLSLQAFLTLKKYKTASKINELSHLATQILCDPFLLIYIPNGKAELFETWYWIWEETVDELTNWTALSPILGEM